MAHPETEPDLAELLAEALGAPVDDLRRLSGGASRETWSFRAGDRPLILQRVRGGGSLSGPSLAAEDALLAAAARAGVPVPPVVLDAPAAEAAGLGPARITGHVDGEALGPRIVRQDRYAEARRHLAAQCGRALAAIHSIHPGDVAGLQPVEPLGRLRDGLDLLGEGRPAFELALRWLHDHRPPTRPDRVVHGDFRVGNLLVDETGLRAVLDWELAHLGDPLEDLGWLCVRAWRFGGEGEVGGVGDLPDLLAAYAEATEAPVDPEHVRWWIVVGSLTWGLICAVQARRHLDGHVRSVELATIGRRVCETEYDLLQLLGLPSPGPVDDPKPAPAADAPATHGRPTAAELVDAVRSHLADVVAPQLEGAAAFQLKVAGNALAIVERELQAGPPPMTADEEAALAAAIRGGAPMDDATATALRAAVVHRLGVANPKWLQGADAPSTEPAP